MMRLRPTWVCGWCDAAVVRDGTPRRTAVRALLLDQRQREFARIGESIAALEPFEAEIAVLEAALRSLAGRAASLRMHTGCDASSCVPCRGGTTRLRMGSHVRRLRGLD